MKQLIESFKYKIRLTYKISLGKVIDVTTSIEIGKVSSRGQIAIPAEMRKSLNLREGEKVLFFSEGDTVVMKKVTLGSFRELTEPLKEAAKQAGLKESEVTEVISRFRKSRK